MISECLEFCYVQRGQWRPRLQDLVRLNTPRAVEIESRRALRQLVQKGIEPAIQNLTKLKGVGPATASGDKSSPSNKEIICHAKKRSRERLFSLSLSVREKQNLF